MKTAQHLLSNAATPPQLLLATCPGPGIQLASCGHCSLVRARLKAAPEDDVLRALVLVEARFCPATRNGAERHSAVCTLKTCVRGHLLITPANKAALAARAV